MLRSCLSTAITLGLAAAGSAAPLEDYADPVPVPSEAFDVDPGDPFAGVDGLRVSDGLLALETASAAGGGLDTDFSLLYEGIGAAGLESVDFRDGGARLGIALPVLNALANLDLSINALETAVGDGSLTPTLADDVGVFEYSALEGGIEFPTEQSLALTFARELALDPGDEFESRVFAPRSSSLSVAAIPEPTTGLLVGMGLLGLAGRRRR